MTKHSLLKILSTVLTLSLIVACTATNNNELDPQEEPQTEPMEELTPEEQYGDIDEPTKNEPNEGFGEELDENIEEDIPEFYLEKDEDTQSSP